MIKTQILVYSTNSALKLEILRTIDERAEFELCGFTENENDFELMLTQLAPKIALIEFTELTAEIFNLLRLAGSAKHKPFVVILSGVPHLENSYQLKCIEEKTVISPPYKGEDVFDAIEEKYSEVKHPSAVVFGAGATEKQLDERLANVFIASGISPHIRGYKFMREAVKLTVSDPSMINNITKKLYPAVAEKYETTPSKVERAIRHAIEVAWMRGKIENINTIYGIKIFGKDDKQTNGELIALISDKMMIECS